MKSETQLLQEENEARQEAAKWRIAFDRSVKAKDRHVVLGALVVLGGFFGAFFLAAHVSYAMAVTIGAAWMGGVWWTVNSERALKKELEEALGKAHAATERAADLRRQIEGSRYLREGVAETASGGRAIKPRKTGPY